MYKVILHRDAIKDYKNLDIRLKTRVNKAIETLKENPYYGSNIKRLTGKLAGMYRYRVGDFRIIYEIHEDINTVRVKIIESRGGVY